MNEWNDMSQIEQAIGHTVVLQYPNATFATGVVYKDHNDQTQYDLNNQDNYLFGPVGWKFKEKENNL